MKLLSKILLPFIALLLMAAGCGDAEPERDQAMVDAFIADIVEDGDGFTEDRDEATCVAEKTFDAFGSERLAELGITPDNPDPSDADLSDQEANDVVDAVFGCIDMKQGFIDEISGDDLSTEDATCVVNELGDDFLRSASLAGLTDPDGGPPADFISDLTSAAETCGVPLN